MPKNGVKRRHWYEVTIYYCPLCGKVQKYRTRVYGKRPAKRDHRVHEREQYDHCDD